ncbi:MAG: hypothetical protein ACI8QS_002069 [Planctomycetota bacterium]|jgi:hypothetical protein
MTSSSLALLSISATALLASCGATTLAPMDPLELLAEPEFEYHASISTPPQESQGINVYEPGEVPPLLLADAVEEIKEEAAGFDDVAWGPFVEVHCTSVTLDPEEAQALLGWHAGMASAVIAKRAVLDERLGQVQGKRPNAALINSSLLILPTQSGSLSILNQTAYVRDFQIQRMGRSIIADPRIGILEEGLTLTVEANPTEAGNVALKLELSSADIQHPHASAEYRLPSGTSVSIQQPLMMTQSMRTGCSLGPDDALLLVMLGDEDSDAFLFTILTAELHSDS